MPHDTDYDDEHYTLVGALLMGAAALLVVALLWWAVQ